MPAAMATLYYHHARPEQLMADLEKLNQGVSTGGIVRVYTPSPETWEQVQGWCVARRYGIVRRTEDYADWVGTVRYLTSSDFVDIEVR